MCLDVFYHHTCCQFCKHSAHMRSKLRTIPSQATSPDGLNLEMNDGGSWFIIKKNEVRMMDIDTLDVEL